jgi:hypothetical protein
VVRYAQRTVKSLAEFIESVTKLEKQWSADDDSTGLWYRGHRKSHWPLIPKLYRDLDDSDTPHGSDDEIREDFIKRAPSLTDRKPENPWEWYFLMQHYGVPTRLLDWSGSALVGLYFAVRENYGYHHAAVWVLDPWRLNKRAIGRDEVLPPGSPGLSAADVRRYSRWLPDRFKSHARWPLSPVAVYPNYVDRRIVAQQSCFTIHGRRQTRLEEMLVGKNDRLAKLTIPSYRVEDIKTQLGIAGLNESTVFPDLGGLGRDINWAWQVKNDDKPHKNVYTRLAPSRIHPGGVGVLAIKRIPKGKELFLGDNDQMLWLKEKSLPKSPLAVRRLYEFAAVKNGRYGCPPTFNRLTMSWYLNHSKHANVACTSDYDFVTVKPIEAGEELTVDYSTFNDPSALDFGNVRSKSIRKKAK